MNESVNVGALVELVDGRGRALGALGKLEAHVAPGRLHRAVSVFLLDGSDRLLVQRRAAAKYHSGGLWSNTCCGHPSPGETPRAAATRRLAFELGLVLPPSALIEAGVVVYEISDTASGLVEREFDHLFVGRSADPLDVNESEVSEVAALALQDLAGGAVDWSTFTAWFPIVLRPALTVLSSWARS